MRCPRASLGQGKPTIVSRFCARSRVGGCPGPPGRAGSGFSMRGGPRAGAVHAAGAVGGEPGAPGVEAAFGDRLAHFLHDSQIEVQVVQRIQARAGDLVGALQMMQVSARKFEQVWQAQLGSSGRVSSRYLALRILTSPKRVNSQPLRALRVGMTQSNMSTPATRPRPGLPACPRPSGSAAPAPAAGVTCARMRIMSSLGSPTDRPPMA